MHITITDGDEYCDKMGINADIAQQFLAELNPHKYLPVGGKENEIDAYNLFYMMERAAKYVILNEGRKIAFRE